MNIGELRKAIEGIDDSIEVRIPLNAGDGFDGMFFTPCPTESGLTKMGIAESEEDQDEIKLLNKPEPQDDAFILVPHGFTDSEHEEKLLN